MNASAQVYDVLFLLPAYGRQYHTKKEALNAWDSGKDFQIYQGPYCSKRDINKLYHLANRILIQYAAGVVEV